MIIRLSGCIITDGQQRVLLVHRNTGECRQWEVPGGKLHADESEEAAAVRELEEELGLRVTIKRRLGSGDFVDKERHMNYAWFLASATEQPTIREPQTFDRMAYFSREDMNQLALSKGAARFISMLDNGTIRL